MNKRKLLSGPYLIWSVAFILIPLAMIFLQIRIIAFREMFSLFFV